MLKAQGLENRGLVSGDVLYIYTGWGDVLGQASGQGGQQPAANWPPTLLAKRRFAWLPRLRRGSAGRLGLLSGCRARCCRK